jgi:phosphoribosyl-ATP pyrophosphohydrolase
MRKRVLLIVILFLLIISQASAEKVELKKFVTKKGLQVNEIVGISLNITNPFSVPLKIRIQDSNILGDSGVDIQCLEREIPPNQTAEFKIEGLQALTPGSFTLEEASVTYTNPVSGEEETVESNRVKLKVRGEKPTAQITQIQEVYECGGVSMRSTRSTMSSTQTIQQKVQQQTQSKTSNMQQQSQQDMNQIKQEMEKRMQQQEQTKQQLQEKIEQDKEFQQMQKQLQEQGYNLEKKETNAVSNSTGDFNYQYRKGEETANIQGSMEEGKMRSIEKRSSEETKKRIEKDEQFKEMKQNLEKQGFRQGTSQLNDKHFSYKFDRDDGEKAEIRGRIDEDKIDNLKMQNSVMEKNIFSKNKSLNKWLVEKQEELLQKGFIAQPMEFNNVRNNTAEFSKRYLNPENNQSIEIRGAVKNETITKLWVEEKRNKIIWWLLFLLLLLLMLIGVLLYRKYSKKKPEPIHEFVEEKQFDYKREAQKLLEEAQNLFSKSQGKDAYTKVSEAVRLYFMHKFKTERELTRNDVIKELRKRNRKTELAEECLELCDLVKFAKYNTNEKDFNRILSLAQKIVK